MQREQLPPGLREPTSETVSSVPRAQEGPQSPGVPEEWPAGVSSTERAALRRPKAGFGFRESRRDARPLPGNAGNRKWPGPASGGLSHESVSCGAGRDGAASARRFGTERSSRWSVSHSREARWAPPGPRRPALPVRCPSGAKRTTNPGRQPQQQGHEHWTLILAAPPSPSQRTYLHHNLAFAPQHASLLSAGVPCA